MRDLILILLFMGACCAGLAFASLPKESARIYFMGALPGPGINVFSADLNGRILRHTRDEGSRDMSYSLDASGNLVITSNRVLDRAVMSRAALAGQSNPKSGRAQDFNILQLPAHRVEVPDKVEPRVLAGSPAQETRGNISPDGQWLAYVKSLTKYTGNRVETTEQLWLKNLATLEQKLVAQGQFIAGSDWAENSGKLLFAAHSHAPERALLQVYNLESETKNTFHEIRDKPVLIDAPQWVPGEEFVSYIRHPLQADTMRQLMVLNLKSQAVRRLSPPHVQVQAPVSWANDGNSVLYSALLDYRQYWDDESRQKTYEGSAQIYLSTREGVTRQLTQTKTGMNMQPVFSPDNSKVAYMYASKPPGKAGKLKVMNLQGDELATLYDRVSGLGYLRWQ